MKNEFNVNLCEYCSRCRFGKLDKNGKRIFYCKFAEPHSYKVEVCSHYLLNLHFCVPRTSIFVKIGRVIKNIFLSPYRFIKNVRLKKVKKRVPSTIEEEDVS